MGISEQLFTFFSSKNKTKMFDVFNTENKIILFNDRNYNSRLMCYVEQLMIWLSFQTRMNVDCPLTV